MLNIKRLLHAFIFIFTIIVLIEIVGLFCYPANPIPQKNNQEKTYQKNDTSGTLILSPVIANTMRGLSCVINWLDTNSDAVVALATIAIALFTWTLWGATTGLLKTANKQAIDNLRAIEASERSAKAAETAANAATGSAKVAEKTLLITHRPWCIFPDKIKIINPLSFEPDKVTVTIRRTAINKGTSPAFRVTYKHDIEVILPNTNIIAYIDQSSRDIHNLATSNMPSIIGKIIMPGNIDEDDVYIFKKIDISQIIQVKVSVLLTLTIMYRDELNIIHYTTQRWQYRINKNDHTYLPTKDIIGFWKIYSLGSIAI